MKSPSPQKCFALFSALAISLALAEGVYAQGRGGPPPGLPRSGKDSAPIDLTGYWVSVVTEDWRFRMVTPPKGDFPNVTGINAAGRAVANAWDPAKDEASGNQCKAYGAASIMRVPSRFHITWQDDNTLKIETDAGMQTRLLHFGGAKPSGPPSLQGYSAASWQMATGAAGKAAQKGGPARGGSLKVVTTNLTPGYLQKNGVPYSDQTTVTEYFDIVKEPDGEQWTIVKTLVEDPVYLTGVFLSSPNLKKQGDASGWNPTACTAR